MPLGAETLQSLCIFRGLGTLIIRQRDEALVREIALRTPGGVRGVLGNELFHAGDHADVGG